jgi:hypothetical protein
VADHNHGNGGSVSNSIQLLEERFDCGVLCTQSYDPAEIVEILRLSVILSSTTSEQGWQMISESALLEHPPRFSDGWHSVLVESFDLENDWAIGKNSWGHENGTNERFTFRFEALHAFRVTKVFFTTDSIVGKTLGVYHPRMERFKGFLDGRAIDCAYMDEETAKYDSEFICEPCPGRPPPLNWIGYEMNQYIAIKLKRSV